LGKGECLNVLKPYYGLIKNISDKSTVHNSLINIEVSSPDKYKLTDPDLEDPLLRYSRFALPQSYMIGIELKSLQKNHVWICAGETDAF